MFSKRVLIFTLKNFHSIARFMHQNFLICRSIVFCDFTYKLPKRTIIVRFGINKLDILHFAKQIVSDIKLFGLFVFNHSFKHERGKIRLFYKVARYVFNAVETLEVLKVRRKRNRRCYVHSIRNLLQHLLEIGRRERKLALVNNVLFYLVSLHHFCPNFHQYSSTISPK